MSVAMYSLLQIVVSNYNDDAESPVPSSDVQLHTIKTGKSDSLGTSHYSRVT